MTARSKGEITQALEAWARGEPDAVDGLMPLVYDELKRLARGQLVRNPGARVTLHTTALVHEAYLKFSAQTSLDLESRSHFYAIAARAMRQVLVDRARKRQAAKRGGGVAPTEFEDEHHRSVDVEVETVLALEQALEALAGENERHVRVVECRFFAGMSVAETALALQVSDRTVERDWMQAKGWLRQQLSSQQVALLSKPQPSG